MAFEVARELKVPIMIHTGLDGFSAPTRLFYLAREFKEIPVVMAHAGGGYWMDALLVAKENDNVFVDMSWASGGVCRQFVKQVGASRLMLATDHPSNVPVELGKWRSLGLAAADLDWVLGKTAVQVYGVR